MFEAAQALSTPCPVASLAREANALVRRFNILDRQRSTLTDALVDRLFALEATACHLRATSAAGLMYQALIALGAARNLADIGRDYGDACVEHFQRLAEPVLLTMAVGLNPGGLDDLRAYYLGAAQIDAEALAA